MEDAADAPHRQGKRCGVAEIALDRFARNAGNRVETAGGTDEDPDAVAALDEQARKMTAEESGRARDERRHQAGTR